MVCAQKNIYFAHNHKAVQDRFKREEGSRWRRRVRRRKRRHKTFVDRTFSVSVQDQNVVAKRRSNGALEFSRVYPAGVLDDNFAVHDRACSNMAQSPRGPIAKMGILGRTQEIVKNYPASSATPAATRPAAIHRRLSTRSCKKIFAATAFA